MQVRSIILISGLYLSKIRELSHPSTLRSDFISLSTGMNPMWNKGCVFDHLILSRDEVELQ